MKWNRKSKIMLLEQLTMYVTAGLSLSQALTVLVKRASKKRAESLERMIKMIESGQNLSAALSAEINMSPSVIGLVSCGETSGSLSQALKASHALLEEQDELVKKVLSSMTYPVVIGLATVGLTIGLIQGIMPQIIPLLSSLHVELPFLTKAVIAISNLVINYGIIGSVVFVAIVALIIFGYKKFQKFRFLAHRLLLGLPFIGKLVNSFSLATFFQSFGTMVESGVLADLAYEKAVSSVGLMPLRLRLENLISTVKSGEKFNVIAENMPPYVESLISAGEASGNLGHTLRRVAFIMGREIDYTLKRLTALVEPAMMMGMGCIVGSIALSIMMPIYDISKTLQH